MKAPPRYYKLRFLLNTMDEDEALEVAEKMARKFKTDVDVLMSVTPGGQGAFVPFSVAHPDTKGSM